MEDETSAGVVHVVVVVDVAILCSGVVDDVGDGDEVDTTAQLLGLREGTESNDWMASLEPEPAEMESVVVCCCP